MSAKYVRDLAKQWAQSLTVPFYDTVNIEQEPTDPIWCTLEFEYSSSEEITFCGLNVHLGTFSLVFFGSAGIGYESLFAAAETDAAVFYLNDDPNQKLTLTLLDTPEEFETTGGVPQFGVAIAINYDYVP